MHTFRTRPWNNEPAPEYVRRSPGMTSAAEKNMLFWLAKNYCDGSGHVIDAGCFMGASTLALAAGLKENPNWPVGRKVLAVDSFETTEGMIRLHPNELVGKRPGDSFFDVFKSVVSPVREMVSAEPTDFLQTTELPEPIELLFVDVAKTLDLNAQIVRLGLTRLIKGHSLLIHQDYIFEFCPWIIATMEHFADRFEIIDFAFGSSFIFRFIGPAISDSEIAAFERLGYREMLPLHLAAQERISESLDTIAGGTIDALPKGIIKQVMHLSYVELARLADGPDHAAAIFMRLPFDDLGQDHMRSRIDRMASRVGA